ncbi:hypothetical protein RhiirC2_801059 [Rhizophagus irregularis]|uniref:Uncharacterized protein n=1 Tax=Rhizophagus irregularis TaxID=588596 RepID=A0A2N1M2W8_9GLOM|nr:hypothetical protein RhiirC2_801059 [Rhizophagus irregularis]
MYMIVEKGIRGEISMVSRRYAHANNPGMGEERIKVKPEWLSDKQYELINYSKQRYVPTKKAYPEPL